MFSVLFNVVDITLFMTFTLYTLAAGIIVLQRQHFFRYELAFSYCLLKVISILWVIIYFHEPAFKALPWWMKHDSFLYFNIIHFLSPLILVWFFSVILTKHIRLGFLDAFYLFVTISLTIYSVTQYPILENTSCTPDSFCKSQLVLFHAEIVRVLLTIHILFLVFLRSRILERPAMSGLSIAVISAHGVLWLWTTIKTVLIRFQVFNYDFLVSSASVLNVVIAFLFLAWIAFQLWQKHLGKQLELAQKANSNNAEPLPVSEELVKQFEHFIHTEKPHLINNLTLTRLAEMLGLSRTRLSHLINSHYHHTYSDYINLLRVNEAKKNLSDPAYEHASLEEIYQASGFNSKTTFNNAFKKVTGTTPSEYRANLGGR